MCSHKPEVLLAATPSNESKHPAVAVRRNKYQIHAAPLARVRQVDPPDVIVVVQLMAITPEQNDTGHQTSEHLALLKHR